MPGDGFIKLYRSMTAWEWYDDPNTKSVFLDMLLEANHKDGSWHGVKIKRGQVVVGRKKLAKKLGISEQSIRTCINRLKSTNEITTTPTNKFSIVTIINYEKYQSYDNKPTNKNNKTLTNNQPAINQQSTTNKNDKNDMIRYDLLSLEAKEAVDLYTENFGKTNIGHIYKMISFYGEKMMYDAINKTIGKKASDPVKYINQICTQKCKYKKDYFLTEV